MKWNEIYKLKNKCSHLFEREKKNEGKKKQQQLKEQQQKLFWEKHLKVIKYRIPLKYLRERAKTPNCGDNMDKYENNREKMKWIK